MENTRQLTGEEWLNFQSDMQQLMEKHSVQMHTETHVIFKKVINEDQGNQNETTGAGDAKVDPQAS